MVFNIFTNKNTDMKNILTLGASSSQSSINKKFANYAANKVDGANVNLIDLNDFEMPIYSSDREAADGIPEAAKKFKQLIKDADGIVISFAEHNGAYSAAFKNVMDWTSRVEQKLWEDKPMLLLATSPGGRGAQTVLGSAAGYFPHMGAQVIATFSLPGFFTNFEGDEIHESYKNDFQAAVDAFAAAL